MVRIFQRSHKKVASAPGSIEFEGPRKIENIRIELLDYDAGHVEERELATAAEALPFRDTSDVTWLNVDGLHDADTLRTLGDHFGLHPLVLEDIVHVGQRPKVEDHGDYLFVVMRMLYLDEDGGELVSEQMSFILGNRWVLSFQERHGDVFGPVRERIHAGRGRARKLGPDYLLYMLVDAVVDHYFVVLEKISDRIEELEDELANDHSDETRHRIHALKRQMIFLRRAVWPAREMVSGIQRAESKLIRKDTGVFLRDVYDHVVQAIDVMDSFRDAVSGLQDLYMSMVSNRMNEVMKVLTIFAAIFVPLTFVAGIYGMNFEHMPELGWKWSYPVFWTAIVAIVVAMLRFFRRRRWL